ncbi:hypothetical protein EVB32_352 [Rhizobium phage RHph_TM39]|uniref:Uncharacterized protein n=2 Tax=Cuauhnahuacvirus TaxID=3044696 RepID=A0A7S5RIJ0_9CAUD|nr:hypothetical protein PQC16_gp284 [Rhizobium phage RHph_TM30]YP_010671505.1 hypothetical protein PQC17_gp285 [Rhizobium phage RHph_Y65]QIG71827.1 hypothetical protein EVB94_376 [Rhizobium phage RHph_TM40]QIG72188.1 hypothetical protein EVB95_375 [Rhizobium phage RHph_TM2_3B]QIG72551.1 hypothetical protein EVB96_375 [Rhizobium phage RHph_TM3_3_6]QIG77320.1 hypothetical protein EVB32_352 [Rhizobium phage RHph_TM39]QIG77580.1 hypothetical protein EVB61_274 [Rhizobium phage RHph_TM21B]QIG77935
MADKTPKIQATLFELTKGKDVLGHATGDKRKVSIVDMTPVINNKTLSVKALAQSTKLYSLTMTIFDVQYSDMQSAEFPLTVSLGDGEYKFAKQIDMRKARAQVRCTCDDFYYTWGYWNKENKTLSGPPMKPYVRKTTNYPERNKEHAPGMCKHLMTLTGRLVQMKILK